MIWCWCTNICYYSFLELPKFGYLFPFTSLEKFYGNFFQIKILPLSFCASHFSFKTVLPFYACLPSTYCYLHFLHSFVFLLPTSVFLYLILKLIDCIFFCYCAFVMYFSVTILLTVTYFYFNYSH